MQGPQCHLGSREPCDACLELPPAFDPAAHHCKVVVDELDEVEVGTVVEIQRSILVGT